MLSDMSSRKNSGRIVKILSNLTTTSYCRRRRSCRPRKKQKSKKGLGRSMILIIDCVLDSSRTLGQDHGSWVSGTLEVKLCLRSVWAEEEMVNHEPWKLCNILRVAKTNRVIIKLFIQSQWPDRDSRNGIIDQDRRGIGSLVPNPLPVHAPPVFPWTGIKVKEHAGVV